MAVTVVGSIVKSAAGRDKNRFFVVLALEDVGFAYIADGRLRKTEKPKKKKLIHLRPTNTVLEPEAWRSNLQLRHSLDAFIQKG